MCKGIAGKVKRVACNFYEIGKLSKQGKDLAKDCIERTIYSLSLKAKMGNRIQMIIPHVGIFILRNSTAAVAFDDNLMNKASKATD